MLPQQLLQRVPLFCYVTLLHGIRHHFLRIVTGQHYIVFSEAQRNDLLDVLRTLRRQLHADY